MPRKTSHTAHAKKTRKSGPTRVRRAARALVCATQRATHAITPHRKLPVRKSATDALTFLRAEHRQILAWLNELKGPLGEDRRRHLLHQVEHALKTHTKLEEEIFYPAFRDAAANSQDLRLYYEAIEEHHAVDLMVPELASASLHFEVFPARAKVLQEIVAQHAKEEETEMFPRARALIGPAALRRLAAEMANRRRTLQHRGPLSSAVAALFSG
jgi:hemerythrin superfamily protein